MKQIVNGDESYAVDFIFYDGKGDKSVPASVSYSVYCLKTKTEILPETPLTPDYSITISLNGDLVVLQDSSNKREKKRICVYVTDSSGNSFTRTYEYEVIASTGLYCG
jgi:hypothetical protein